MNVTEILPLIYESKKINNPDIICPQIEKEEEIKKDKDCESNNLVKRTVPNKPSRKDSLFKDDSHNNKFPILIQGKIKLPIFISFDKTTENDKGNQFNKQNLIMIVMSSWKRYLFCTIMKQLITLIYRIKS